MTNPDDDGEEIADDLSEISDEADDILGQQEVNKYLFKVTKWDNDIKSNRFSSTGIAS